jgi:hypothetical protein
LPTPEEVPAMTMRGIFMVIQWALIGDGAGAE